MEPERIATDTSDPVFPLHGAHTAPRTFHSVHALRFVAAFAVLVHHSLTAFGPPLTEIKVGAAGVDIFFVISGVVIGYTDHNDGALSFAMKRVIRVIPLYWTATLTYGIVRYHLFGEIPTTGRVLHSLFLIPDFSPAWAPIYYPAWTLCYEMAFYLLFAALLRWTGRATTLVAAVLTAAIAAMRVPVPFGAGVIFGTSPCVEFAIGLLLAEALNRGFRVPPRLGAAAFALGLVGFALSCRDFSFRELHWGVPAALMVFGAIGLEPHPIWRNPWLTLGGSASYAIYLFHISAMEPLLRALEGAGLDLRSRLRFIGLRELLLLGVAVGAGVTVHLWIERPMLRLLRRAMKHHRKQGWRR